VHFAVAPNAHGAVAKPHNRVIRADLEHERGATREHEETGETERWMRTRRYHFGDRPSRTLLPFLRISPERRMVERENFPSRMSLSLSFFAPNEGSSARQKHRRRRSLSTLSLAFVSIAEKRQRGVCLSSKISARVCSNSRPMGKFNPQKLCALSLSCASLETKRRTKNVAREYSRSLDGLAMPARLSRSRIRECKEREKRSKICPEIASFFPSFLYFSN